MSLRELANRIAAATGPDRELDAALIKAFCPSALISKYLVDDDEHSVFHAQALGIADKERSPPYTASLDAALALCARLKPGWGYFIRRDEDGCNAALLYPYASRVTPGSRQHPTSPALALLAALVAAEMEGEDG